MNAALAPTIGDASASGLPGGHWDQPADTERVAQQQRAVLAFGRRTSAQPSLPILMQDAVALLCEVLRVPRGAVAEMEGDRIQLRLSARNRQASAPLAVSQSYSLEVDGSLAAFALRSGNLVSSNDLRVEKQYHDKYLISQGIVSALAIPLHFNGKPFGVLAVFDVKPHTFSHDEATFAETIAHLLSTSIARIKAEQKVHEAGAFRAGIMGMVDAMVVTLDMEGRVVDMNKACERATKFRLEEVRNQPLWQSLVPPEDAELVRNIFQGSQKGQCPNSFKGQLTTRDGGRRNVSWSMKVLATGQVQTILLTGSDKTAQTEIKAELRRVRALTEQTTATLNQLSSKLDRESDVEEQAATTPDLAGQIPLESIEEVSDGRQRRSARRSYRVPQWIATTNDDRIPAADDLIKVDFWDLSACGCSFFMDQLTGADTFVVALGQPGSLSYFSARVMRVARMAHEGKTRYLIGCDFLKRLA